MFNINKKRNFVPSIFPYKLIKDDGGVLEVHIYEEIPISFHADNLEIFFEYASLNDILRKTRLSSMMCSYTW